jgi:hypothetical protein
MLLTDAVIGVPEVATLLRDSGFELRVDRNEREMGVVTKCWKGAV